MVRLKYIFNYSLTTYDATWENTDVVIWSIIEIYTAMICASLMAIRPLLVKWFPRFFPASTTKQNTSYVSNQSWRPQISHRSNQKIWSRNDGGLELASTEDVTGNNAGGIKKTTQFALEVETQSPHARSETSETSIELIVQRDIERG